MKTLCWGSHQAMPCRIRAPRAVRGRGVVLQGCSKAPAEAPRLAPVPTRLQNVWHVSRACSLGILPLLFNVKVCQSLVIV